MYVKQQLLSLTITSTYFLASTNTGSRITAEYDIICPYDKFPLKWNDIHKSIRMAYT